MSGLRIVADQREGLWRIGREARIYWVAGEATSKELNNKHENGDSSYIELNFRDFVDKYMIILLSHLYISL